MSGISRKRHSIKQQLVKQKQEQQREILILEKQIQEVTMEHLIVLIVFKYCLKCILNMI